MNLLSCYTIYNEKSAGGGVVKDPYKRRYLYLMLSIFGAISLSIVVFFAVFRFQGIGTGLQVLSGILAPFIYGGVVAYLLRPLCGHYERFLYQVLPIKMKKASSALSIGLSLVTGLLIVYALIIMIAPQLVRSIMSLWETLPGKVTELLSWARVTFGEDEALVDFASKLYNQLYAQVDNWGRDTMMPYLTNVMNIVGGVGTGVYRVFKFFYNLLIGLIVACYLLSGRRKLGRQGELIIRSLFKKRWAELILEEIQFADRMFAGFIDGKILDSGIIGMLCYLGCILFRFPNPLLVSAIVGVTNVIPFFGPFIGGIPATLLIMIEDPIKGLWFILFVLALQQLDGNIIGPKILGNRTGLSSFWVLFAILLFGGLWGLPGMVICVPLFAVIYDLVKRLVRRGLVRKDQVEVWEKYKADFPDEE